MPNIGTLDNRHPGIIIKKTRQLMTKHYANQKVSLLTVGKKGSEILAKTNQVVSSHDALFDELTYNKVSEVAQQVEGIPPINSAIPIAIGAVTFLGIIVKIMSWFKLKKLAK